MYTTTVFFLPSIQPPPAHAVMVPTRPPGLRPALEPVASNQNKQGGMRRGKSFGKSQKPSPRWSALRRPVDKPSEETLPPEEDPLCYSPLAMESLDNGSVSGLLFQSPVDSEFLETPEQGQPARRKHAQKAAAEKAAVEKAAAEKAAVEKAAAQKAAADIALADAEKARLQLAAKLELQAEQAKLEMQAAHAKLEMQRAQMDAERARLDTERAWLELEKEKVLMEREKASLEAERTRQEAERSRLEAVRMVEAARAVEEAVRVADADVAAATAAATAQEAAAREEAAVEDAELDTKGGVSTAAPPRAVKATSAPPLYGEALLAAIRRLKAISPNLGPVDLHNELLDEGWAVEIGAVRKATRKATKYEKRTLGGWTPSLADPELMYGLLSSAGQLFAPKVFSVLGWISSFGKGSHGR